MENPEAISAKCYELSEPLFITKDGEVDMVIMSMETFRRYEEALAKYSKPYGA